MSGQVDKIDEKEKCDICFTNFVGCGTNSPVKKPCGCIFHKKCLQKHGGDGTQCPGLICFSSVSGSSSTVGCDNCKDLRYELQQVTSQNAELKETVKYYTAELGHMRTENEIIRSDKMDLRTKLDRVCKTLDQLKVMLNNDL